MQPLVIDTSIVIIDWSNLLTRRRVTTVKRTRVDKMFNNGTNTPKKIDGPNAINNKHMTSKMEITDVTI